MERTKYLQMARECAMLTERGLFNIAVNVPDALKVTVDGIKYYPESYELGFNHDGSVRHTAIVHDLKANSILSAPLEKVKEWQTNKT